MDFQSIRTIEHACAGCSVVKACCCSKYEILVDRLELKRILQALPEAAKLCQNLKTGGKYENVFEEAENGFFSIDTLDNGLCVFAYRKDRMIRCSLHSTEISLGLPLGALKPKVCILWPLTFNQKGNALTVHHDALSFACNQPRQQSSRHVSSELLQTIGYFRTGGFGSKSVEMKKRKKIKIKSMPDRNFLKTGIKDNKRGNSRRIR